MLTSWVASRRNLNLCFCRSILGFHWVCVAVCLFERRDGGLFDFIFYFQWYFNIRKEIVHTGQKVQYWWLQFQSSKVPVLVNSLFYRWTSCSLFCWDYFVITWKYWPSSCIRWFFLRDQLWVSTFVIVVCFWTSKGWKNWSGRCHNQDHKNPLLFYCPRQVWCLFLLCDWRKSLLYYWVCLYLNCLFLNPVAW